MLRVFLQSFAHYYTSGMNHRERDVRKDLQFWKEHDYEIYKQILCEQKGTIKIRKWLGYAEQDEISIAIGNEHQVTAMQKKTFNIL